MNDARAAAYSALLASHREKAWSEIYLSNLIKKESLDRKNAALAFKLTYGVLQNTYYLDYIISKFSTQNVNKLDLSVRIILRLSLYQIFFLDKIPVSAAVNEGVKLAKRYASRASGFVNAVLRKASVSEIPAIDKTGAEYLSIRYSHPMWIVNYYIERLGIEETEKLLGISNEMVAISAQVNTLKTTPEEVFDLLKQNNIEFEINPYDNTNILLKNTGFMEDLEIFKNGFIYVQDEAAKLAIIAAGILPNSLVLDTCAAPGGKSFASAIQMNNEGKIVSCDLHENKLRFIDDGAKRLGIDIISTTQADGKIRRTDFENKFDVVIIDVPCSGLGIIRKKPDIRFKTEEEVQNLPSIQYEILLNSSHYVQPNGVLIYSTCTIRSEENEEVVKRFLKERTDFELVSFNLPIPSTDNDGMMTFWPHIHNTDGFFVSKLRRKC